VPVKETVNGELAALLEIERDALRVPAAEGMNTTCTVQDAPTASVAEQPAATLKLLAAAPEKLVPLIVIADAPVFVTVTDRGVEATPTVAEGNVSAEGETDRLEEGGGVPPLAAPVPVKGTTNGELAELFWIDREALRVPAAEGVKEIDTAQLAATATLAPHVLETIEKSLAFEPPSPTAESTRGTLPLLVSVIVCGIEVTPTFRDEYVNIVLESDAVGIPPLPVRGMCE
jgi:hypothetical protein